MREATLQLFDEFAASFSGGRNPDLREFLTRAGDEAAVLAQLVDGFLAGSEPPPLDEEQTELMRAWARGQPPLLELRKARRLKRGEVVSRLTSLLGLAAERETKVARYYHRLEGGLIEPRGIDQRVWAALTEVFGRDVRGLADWRIQPPAMALAYRFAEMPGPEDYVPPELGTEDDEVDRLFRSGS